MYIYHHPFPYIHHTPASNLPHPPHQKHVCLSSLPKNSGLEKTKVSFNVSPNIHGLKTKFPFQQCWEAGPLRATWGLCLQTQCSLALSSGRPQILFPGLEYSSSKEFSLPDHLPSPSQVSAKSYLPLEAFPVSSCLGECHLEYSSPGVTQSVSLFTSFSRLEAPRGRAMSAVQWALSEWKSEQCSPAFAVLSHCQHAGPRAMLGVWELCFVQLITPVT